MTKFAKSWNDLKGDSWRYYQYKIKGQLTLKEWIGFSVFVLIMLMIMWLDNPSYY